MINLDDYLTIKQAQEAMGCSLRAVWRAIDRVGRDKITVSVLGRTLVPKGKLNLLKANYFPYYSPEHQSMVKIWGAQGGTKRAANMKKSATARPGGRGRAAASGKSDAPAAD